MQFLREYGGGFFASCGDIYSVEPQGDWHLGSYQPHYNNQNFVAFANNGCGDSYGFIVSEGKCQPEVYFWDHESGGEISKTKFEDFFEFIAAQLRERIL